MFRFVFERRVLIFILYIFVDIESGLVKWAEPGELCELCELCMAFAFKANFQFVSSITRTVLVSLSHVFNKMKERSKKKHTTIFMCL